MDHLKYEPFEIYEVQEGDTIDSIASQAGKSRQEILQYDGEIGVPNRMRIPTPNSLEPGAIVLLPRRQVPPIKIKADASGIPKGTPAKVEVYEMFKEDPATDVLVSFDTEVTDKGTVEVEWDCRYPRDKVKKPPMFIFKVRVDSYMMTIPKTFGIKPDVAAALGAKEVSVSTFNPFHPGPPDQTIDIHGKIEDMGGTPRKNWPVVLRKGGVDGPEITRENAMGAATENEFKDGHWITDDEGCYSFEGLPKGKYFVAPLGSSGEVTPGSGEKLEVDGLERDEEHIIFVKPDFNIDKEEDQHPAK
jgi:hypothetical protein